jgi:hypothetical protein
MRGEVEDMDTFLEAMPHKIDGCMAAVAINNEEALVGWVNGLGLGDEYLL